MGKGIYTYYKERLIEIGGNNKCLYLKNVTRKSAYDLGRLFEGRDSKISEFINFLTSDKSYPISLIDKKEKSAILKNLEICARIKSAPEGADIPTSELESLVKKNEKALRDAESKAIKTEIERLKELKRETEEIERETGRYELYIGYPFVFGCIQQGASHTPIKAPLLLFPVTIDILDESTVEIRRNEAQKIQINQALVFAYAQAKRMSIDNLELEFDTISHIKSAKDIVDYLAKAHIKIGYQSVRNIFSYAKFREPETERTELAVRSGAVIGRFPLANSIYNDYSLLEKKNLTNDAINELLRTGKQKTKPSKKQEKQKKGCIGTESNSYIVKMLDYAQSEVVKKVDKNGNMVIYGPPGTGKSQTIVNIITDALSKNKRVLVVSQKRAALDVVYNRLGPLNHKAMYIIDESKEKQSFYDRCYSAHLSNIDNTLIDVLATEEQYNGIQAKIDAEVSELEHIHTLLNKKREFGLSLSEMYNSSYMPAKNSVEYAVYLKMIEDSELMALDYSELKEALFGIRSMELSKTFYNFLEDKKRNPLIDHMQPETDLRTLSEVKGLIEEIQKSKKGLFNIAKYPYYRQVLAYFDQVTDDKTLNSLVKMEMKLEGKSKLFSGKEATRIRKMYLETHEAIREFVSEYDCLLRAMTRDGYIAVIDNILRGNYGYLRLVNDALENYIALRDTAKMIADLPPKTVTVLNFAYYTSKNYQHYLDIIDKLMVLRIYHEVLRYEDDCRDEFSRIVDYVNITTKIMKLKEEQLALATKICEGKNGKDYAALYESAKNNKDYLYQISKKQKFWPIRKMTEVYQSFVLSLFPCWLLSPENVSSLLPLEKNLFDVVIFDEASQIFIESTIPTIYRGKNIVVAGDAKQLRPSSTFMRRFLGTDPETHEDYSVQAALEVESLLDLAVARYESANLTYHYRSKSQELIDFSNYAFYSTNLCVAPNVTKNLNSKPIERHLVSGKWVDRKNVQEARKIVEILTDIFKTRQNNESIGIITFNSDQQACIADAIDRESAKSPEFRSFITKETHRFENGEDTGLFIKNLENVQGDERDIIIFSIGYAKNELGRVYTNFGSLSAEGGENRLNVAITRAKTKIVVVTSIEPEELKIESSKNLGPKLLKKYLTYVRAVSEGNDEEVKSILTELDSSEARLPAQITKVRKIEEQIKDRLEKLGYKVDVGIGNMNNRISLAVYDEKLDRYLVGVELDRDAFASSASCLERDVYKPKFLESRGWTIVRVWCRDWWLNPSRVIKIITTLAEKNRAALKK